MVIQGRQPMISSICFGDLARLALDESFAVLHRARFDIGLELPHRAVDQIGDVAFSKIGPGQGKDEERNYGNQGQDQVVPVQVADQ